MIGVTGDQRSLFDDDALGNPSVSSAVQAVVDWFGQTDFLAIDAQYEQEGVCGTKALKYDPPDSLASVWFGAPIQTIPDLVNAASPMAYISTERVVPPFEIDHGDVDCEVPVDQSRELNDALKKAGASVNFTVLAGAGHGDPIFYSKQFVSDMSFVETTFGIRRE
jgi:acetyl esterase/lipase